MPLLFTASLHSPVMLGMLCNTVIIIIIIIIIMKHLSSVNLQHKIRARRAVQKTTKQ